MFFIGNLKNQHVNDPKMSGYDIKHLYTVYVSYVR